jgi:hypothetical protein
VDVTVAQKKAAYVPNHMRGADGQRTTKVEGWDADVAAERVRSMVARRQANRMPEGGADAPSKGPSKNAKKRAAKKAKAAEAGDANVEDVAEGVAQVAVGSGAEAASATAEPASDAAADAKRIR